MRLVVWGLGKHAIHKILPAVSTADGLELYGVCSRNPVTVADSSRMWDCRSWTDPTSMLGDPQVDIVYVATPIGLHAENGRAVLAAGKHLWCEKPLTSRLRDTAELLASSRSTGLSVFEAHMYLYHPQFHRLATYISGGRLGRILSVSCRFGIPKLEHPGFRSDAALGGSALLDVGCYPVSAIIALFPGDPARIRYSSVSARDGGAVDTDGYSVLELSGGAEAVLEWRTNAAYRNEIELWGEEGSLFTERVFSKSPSYRPSFRLRDLQGLESVEYSEPADHFVRMLETFRVLVEDGQAMESERNNISRRASLIDQIQMTSSSRSQIRA
jgi:dTDP-3,4-didehydro-2,6-dideoxy-alpha-D-glucose 3-reductase